MAKIPKIISKYRNLNLFFHKIKGKPLSSKTKPDKILLISLLGFSAILTIGAWTFASFQGLTVSYNDAMSHLNLARAIIDNQQPGLTQLGGVWLPLNHLLSLPLIWNNWAWHSGFAGSLISMIAYLVSVWGIYQIVKLITKNPFAAFLAGLTYALNLNILYLQTTPLTESLYLGLFILSILVFIKWLNKDRFYYLILLGILAFFQVLTRYDGWFVLFIQGLLVLIHQLFKKSVKFQEAIGKVMIFLLPGFFGIFLWILWNTLIFNDPLFFILGPYSAHAQQALIGQKTVLITKSNIILSILDYTYSLLDNIGLLTAILAGIGLGIFLFSSQIKIKLHKKLVIIFFLMLPAIFNIITLYLGFSILNVPELKWNPSPNPSGQWFNVRYGVLGLPLAAISVGIVGNWKKYLLPVVLLLILFQLSLTYQSGIITITDGTLGSSAFENQDIADKLKNLVKPSDQVLMSTSYYNAVGFRSGLQLRQIIHEGVSDKWDLALVNPRNYAKWIVMANGNIGEPVYTSLVINEKNQFLGLYKLIYKGSHANIYQLKQPNEIFVGRNGSNLSLESSNFRVSGVNSYDLAYKSHADIITTFKSLNTLGVSTVRFWLFGDGLPEGFQPQSGITNENRLQSVDFILSQAPLYNIRLIPVLVNNWPDYGGKNQYLNWTGKNLQLQSDEFYSDSDIRNLFKNYINKVITRNNTLTHISYMNDPAILAWDIMNEPRVGQSSDAPLLFDWTKDISFFIKTLDQNHLIMVGNERITSSSDLTPAYNLCSIDTIDICSVHLYLEHSLVPDYQTLDQVRQFLKDQENLSAADSKPMIIGEFGVPKLMSPFDQNPIGIMTQISGQSAQDSYNGLLIWNWSLLNDQSYGFSPSGDSQGGYDQKDLKAILDNFQSKEVNK